MPDQDSSDLRFMHAALALGRRSMGLAAPNPSVGALLVKDGFVVGRGVTASGGRPHAEPLALAQAGEAARGATLYVTLEPCSHHGRSPPCAEAVVASGVKRVVAAMRDPDSRVAGRGFARLRDAGLEVIEGVAREQARCDHLGHIRRVTLGRPMVTVKMAETADGVAGSAPGQPRLMITGSTANGWVHMLRAAHDALIVGRGTVAADDPLLTVRLPGMSDRRPMRIVLDTTLAIATESRVVETAPSVPTLVLTAPEASAARAQILADRGVAISRLVAGNEGLDLSAIMQDLGSRGLTRVLCEGGPTLASALILAGLADRVILLTGSRAAGGGRPALTRAAQQRIEDGDAYRLCDDALLGSDRMRVYDSTDLGCLQV